MKENTILVFGASITWGANDTEHGGWVELLKNFAAKRTNYYCAVYNLGISGDTSDLLLKRLTSECEARSRYGINTIIIAIGGNDSRYLKEETNVQTTPEKFRKNIQEIIDIAKRFVKNVVFVGILPFDESRTTPIPWDPIKYYINKLAQRNNDIIREECKKNGLLFVDLFEEWNRLDYKKLLDDGLHPTTEGHKKIFETVSTFLVENKLL